MGKLKIAPDTLQDSKFNKNCRSRARSSLLKYLDELRPQRNITSKQHERIKNNLNQILRKSSMLTFLRNNEVIKTFY